MADQNLDIVIRVRGGQVASSEIQGVSKATAQVGTTTEETTKKTSKLGQTLKGVATGIAVYKGYQFLKGAVSETSNLAKSTAGLQRITGLDAKTAAGWVVTAKERGIQSKQLNQGFIGLSKGIATAASGSKAGVQAFAQLGLNAQNLKVQDTRTQMGMLADSFAALPAGVDKAALAQKMFGRQAQAMLPLLNGGSKALNEQIDATGKQTGITNGSLKSGLALVKQQRELSTAMMGVKLAVGTALIPVITGLTTAIVPLAQGFAKLMQQSPAFRVAIYATAAALTALKLAMFFGAGFGVGAIIAAIVGIVTVLVILYNKCAWFRNAVNAVFGAVKSVMVGLFNWAKSNWPLLAGILLGPFALAIAEIVKHWGAIKNAASATFNWLKGAVGTVAGAIKSVLGGAFDAVKSSVLAVKDAIQSMIDTARSIAHLPGKALNAIEGAGSGLLSGAKSLFGGQGGGYVPSGGRYTMVGEQGPEIVALPGGTQVIPNHVIAGMGGTHNVTVPVYLDSRQIALGMGSYVAGQQAAR